MLIIVTNSPIVISKHRQHASASRLRCSYRAKRDRLGSRTLTIPLCSFRAYYVHADDRQELRSACYVASLSFPPTPRLGCLACARLILQSDQFILLGNYHGGPGPKAVRWSLEGRLEMRRPLRSRLLMQVMCHSLHTSPLSLLSIFHCWVYCVDC